MDTEITLFGAHNGCRARKIAKVVSLDFCQLRLTIALHRGVERGDCALREVDVEVVLDVVVQMMLKNPDALFIL